ncbi:hypothetical protein HK102_013400, partial [Quaeritorhiza haematococci]
FQALRPALINSGVFSYLCSDDEQKKLYHYFGSYPIHYYFIGYGAVPVVLGTLMVLLQPRTSFESPETHTTSLPPASKHEDDGIESVIEEEIEDVAAASQQFIRSRSRSASASSSATTTMTSSTASGSFVDADADLGVDVGGGQGVVADESTPLIARSTEGGVANSLLKNQLKSAEFWGVVVTTCVFMVRMNMYISSIREQLMDKPGTREDVDAIVETFNIALPAGGILSIPFVGALLDYTPSYFVFFCLWAVGIAFSVLGMVSDLQIQYASVFIFVFLRPLLYTSGNDFCAKTFGFKTFGRIYGLMNLMAGIVNLTQYAFLYIALDLMSGHFWLVNIIQTALIGLLIFFPIRLFFKARKEKRAGMEH